MAAAVWVDGILLAVDVVLVDFSAGLAVAAFGAGADGIVGLGGSRLVAVLSVGLGGAGFVGDTFGASTGLAAFAVLPLTR